MPVVLTVSKLAGFLFVGLMLTAAGAAAQGSSTDPQADSPAGAIYELPLDGARGDAAPKRPSTPRAQPPGAADVRTGAGAAGSAAPSSAIRSENGFGSSSAVPGATGGGATDGGSGVSNGGSSDGSGSPAARNSASSGEADGFAPRAPKAATAHAAVESEPSGLRTYGLLALVLVAALAGGLATRLRGRSGN